MISCDSVKFILLVLLSVLSSLSKCTIDLTINEIQYLSDHLTQEECHKLVATLHFENFNVPQQAAAAERKLPDDVSCRDLLLHWNSEEGEGKGRTHVDVCHRLNQIDRQDLADWLSKTVFHQLSQDLEDSLSFSMPEKTSHRAARVTESGKQIIVDETPWLNLDSVLAVLILLAISAFGCGFVYLLFLCISRMFTRRKVMKSRSGYKEETRKAKTKEGTSRENAVVSSEDETAALISKDTGR